MTIDALKYSAVPRPWSLDARVLVRPDRTFRSLASASPTEAASPLWIAARRPVFLTFVLACVVSLLATSVATIRLIATAVLYWSFVPVIEILALTIILRRRRVSKPLPIAIDLFFAGHAAWALFLLSIGATMAMAPPNYWWSLIIGPGLVGMILVVAWSAYVDVCFFRHMCGTSLARAIGNAALHRLMTWMLVVWIFAVPTPTPFSVFHHIARDLVEVMR